MTGVAVRPVAVADLAVAARLHAALLPHGFPFTVFQLLTRAFYARSDTRTPMLANAALVLGVLGVLGMTGEYRHAVASFPPPAGLLPAALRTVALVAVSLRCVPGDGTAARQPGARRPAGAASPLRRDLTCGGDAEQGPGSLSCTPRGYTLVRGPILGWTEARWRRRGPRSGTAWT